MARSVFNLSHEHKTSVDMGQLIPVYTDEVLPGDTLIHSCSALARVAPLARPLMHRCELRMHTFYCPNRLLYREVDNTFDWDEFITGNDDTTPKPTYTTTASDPLLDYMGVPQGVAGVEVDAAPIALANMVYNHFYRDQDLQTERAWDDLTIPKCAWQKDYFTVARPNTQKGDPIEIPFNAGQMPARDLATLSASAPAAVLTRTDDQTQVADTSDWRALYAPGSTATPRVYADMAGATGGILIDDLRQALALQRFAEARMRYGSRIIDYLRYIGVNPRDGRLDRPEYLGGGKEILNFSEVLATAEGSATNVGDMLGHGIGLGRSNSYRKMFEEHGWVMTFLSIRPKTVYQNALPKKFTRSTVMDYWQPEMETLPWQELKESEVHIQGSPDNVFGYVPRFEEYRHAVSHVSGTLRGGTENDYHMARDFPTPPSLNGDFIECTPTERIYQDANQPNVVVNCMHNIKKASLVGATASMGQGL